MNAAPSTPHDAPEPGPAQPAPAASGTVSRPGASRALLTMVIDIVVPIAVFYGVRGAGGSVWLALALGAVAPAASAVAGLVRGRRPDTMGVMILATLALSAGLSLLTGSPRVLLARDGLLTGAWAAYMYLSLLARRPATFVISRPLLEGRRVYDPAQRRWVRSAARTWDELWEQVPRFQSIWLVCTVIWGTAILADAVVRVVMAYALPVGVVPALGGALWPVTFIVLQVITNVYFARAGFWRILQAGA
ncbi:MAG: VC0807 family protein [Streptosporangiaceae bacterium]